MTQKTDLLPKFLVPTQSSTYPTMNGPSQYVFKLGFKVALDNGKFFIRIGEELIEFASLSPAPQQSIQKALLAAGKYAGPMTPWMPVVGAGLFAYSTWQANIRAHEAREERQNAERQAEEARAQAEEARQTAQTLQTQLDR